MDQVEIRIFNQEQKLIKSTIAKTPSDLCFAYDMFSGIRSFDMTAQFTDLIDQKSIENQQNYALFCTYVKFGEAIQERADFTVKMMRLPL